MNKHSTTNPCLYVKLKFPKNCDGRCPKNAKNLS